LSWESLFDVDRGDIGDASLKFPREADAMPFDAEAEHGINSDNTPSPAFPP
jgi:hypothetical protein